jgi:hypothetical protein
MAVRAIDDNEATPDDVFMAIATARGRGRAPVATVPSALTPVTFAPTPSAADRLLGAPATMATGAGLASALVASPVAAALRGAIGAAAPGTQGHRTPTPRSSMLTAPVDVRSLSPAAVAMAYLALPADLGPSIGDVDRPVDRPVDWDVARRHGLRRGRDGLPVGGARGAGGPRGCVVVTRAGGRRRRTSRRARARRRLRAGVHLRERGA